MRAAGVVAGDRVAGLLPNVPEAAIAMLATASIGATWSGCAPDDGIEQWLDHCRQIAPKVLFAVDGCDRGAGAPGILTQVRQRVPSVELIVGPAGPDARAFEQFGTAAHDIDFASLPFDQPLYITRTAHTSSVIHGAGGVLLQQQKEHLLHIDVRRGDRFVSQQRLRFAAMALAERAGQVQPGAVRRCSGLAGRQRPMAVGGRRSDHDPEH
ncbi:MAG: hypothetical protein IPK87_17355 [Planctomycetes bacterium]|nr:hypothetical protein [Planctomycetota bacterium]